MASPTTEPNSETNKSFKKQKETIHMRIQRSMSSHLSHASHRVLLTIVALIITAAISIAATIAYQQYTNYNASAAPGDPTPEACFAFNSATGAITNYYNHENNDSSQPACPKDVDILSTIGGVAVTSVGDSAFYQKQLTSVTIPSSVNTIGGYAFADNKISSFSVEGNPTSVSTDILRGNPVTSISYNGVIYNDTVNTADQCFDIDSASGAILKYKQADLQLIKSSGIACLARDVTIPSTVSGTTIVQIGGVECGASWDCVVAPAFSGLGITSVVIPNSVTTIYSSAFSSNQLTSVTIPSSVTSISEMAFSNNQLTSVTIPSSVTSIDSSAFALQSQWGRDIVGGESGAPSIWSDDPAEVQRAYDSIWYVRLYTEDPSNPNGLMDGAVYEAAFFSDDKNNNGHMNDSLGGYLINPASLDLHYVNQANTDLQTSRTFTGQLSDGTYIPNYYASKGPLIPAPADPYNATPAEEQAIQDALAAYYRLGDTVTITPPAIDGYITPPTKTFVLGAAANSENYVYTQASNGSTGTGGSAGQGGSSDSQLAETGTDITHIAVFSIVAIGLGIASCVSARKRKGVAL